MLFYHKTQNNSLQNIFIIAEGNVTDNVNIQLIVRSLETSNSICKIDIVTYRDSPLSSILLKANDAVAIHRFSLAILKQIRKQNFDLTIVLRNSLASIILRNLVKQKSTYVFSEFYKGFRTLKDPNSLIQIQLGNLKTFLKPDHPSFTIKDRIRIPMENLEFLSEFNLRDWNQNKPQSNATILISGRISRQFEMLLIAVLNNLTQKTSFNYTVIFKGIKDLSFKRIKETIDDPTIRILHFTANYDDIQTLSVILKSEFLITNCEEWRYFSQVYEKKIPCYLLSIKDFDKQKINGKRPNQNQINESKFNEIDYFIRSRNSVKI
jgi:ADP-heptose:LPS heptosyltransferase